MSRTISVEIVGDASSLEHAFRRSGSAANTFERDIGKAGRGATAATLNFHGLGRAAMYAGGSMLGAAGFVEGAKASINEATNLEDQLRRTSAVFKSSAGTVKAWSKDSAESMGLSRSSALEAANTIGTLLINVGKTPTEAAKMSKSMVKLASDMAAFKKVKPEVALQALESALQGRTRSLKQFGITIDAAALKQEAYRTGVAKTSVVTAKVTAAEERRAIAQAKLTKAEQDYGANTTQVAQARLAFQRAEDAVTKAQAGSTGQLTAGQKSLAAYSLILEQTKNQQGAFKSSSNELNIVEQKLHAQLQNVEATLGTALIPVMEKYGNELDHWLEKEQKNGNLQRDLNEAVKLLSIGVHDAAAIVHAAGDAFHYLSDAVGGDKHAVELLIGAWALYKTTVKGLALVELAQGVFGVGTAATTAAGEVSGLRAALIGLGSAEVLGPLALAAAGVAAVAYGFESASKHLRSFQVKGGLLTQDTQTGGYSFRPSTGNRGSTRPHPVSSAQAAAMLGQAGLTNVTNNGGQVPHGHAMPAAPAGGGTYSNAQLQALWIQAGGNPAMAPLMAQIAFSESGGRSGIVNSIGATGLWQIYNGPGHSHGLTQYLSPLANARAAVAKFNSQGLGAWDASKHAWSNTAAYQAYLASSGASSGTPTTAGGVPLTVGTKAGKPKGPHIIRGDALIGAGLANAISIYTTKASGSATANDALYWLQLERKDLEKAQAELHAKIGKGSAAQRAATAAEVTKVSKQLDSVNSEMEKAKKAIADERFAVQVKNQVGRFIVSLHGLDTKYAALMFRTRIDTGKALQGDYDAIQSNLEAQKRRLQDEAAKLTDELAGKDKTQRAAIEQQIQRVQTLLGNVNSEIRSNLDSQLQGLQQAVSAAQSSVGSAWSTYSGEIVAEFERQTQQQLAALAKDPRFFQGSQTPAEKMLASMQAQDQLASLKDAIAQAKLGGDPKAVAAAERQLREYQLGIRAQHERSRADQAYAAAVESLTAQRTEQEGELTKTLGEFGQHLQDGTASVSDLQAWLAGANPFGVDFGVNLEKMDANSLLVKDDFKDLSDQTLNLRDAFDALITWINDQTGSAVPTTSGGGGGTPSGGAGSNRGAHLALASGGIVRRPTVALIGEGGPEAVIPLGRISSDARREIHLHVHAGTVIGANLQQVARDLKPYIDAQVTL